MPENLDDLLAVLNQLPEGSKYRLVAGNTGTGKLDAGNVFFSFFSGLPH
jgi:hypothetical protein